MKKFFDHERGFWKVLGSLGDIIMLNIVFFVLCIPIVTIGAAKTALYAVTKKMAKNEEGYITREFFQQFKENFKTSTKIWLLYLVASIFPIYNLYACSLMDGGAFVTFCVSMMILTLVVINWTMIYALVLQSTFENTLKNTLKNALLMSVGHFPYSVVILIVELSPFLAVIFFTQYLAIEMPLIMCVWFALAAYINSHFFNKIFAKYME